MGTKLSHAEGSPSLLGWLIWGDRQTKDPQQRDPKGGTALLEQSAVNREVESLFRKAKVGGLKAKMADQVSV